MLMEEIFVQPEYFLFLHNHVHAYNFQLPYQVHHTKKTRLPRDELLIPTNFSSELRLQFYFWERYHTTAEPHDFLQNQKSHAWNEHRMNS